MWEAGEPVATGAGDVAALDRLAGGAAGQRGGVDQPQVVAPRRADPGQMVDGLGQQRRGGLESFVVAGLLGQVAEQVTEPAVREADPAVLAVESEQHLSHGQADQLGVGQAGPATPAVAGRCHVIVDLDIQCGQEGVQVSCHRGSWTPSIHVTGVRHAVFKESII